MIVRRHGVPHKVTFDWRGAFLWIIQIMALAVFVSMVK